jgi:hypothetical protein
MGFKRDFFRGNFVFDSTSLGIWKDGVPIYNLPDIKADMNGPNEVVQARFICRMATEMSLVSTAI